MKPNEPSRTALMIARQRAAHQVLDHGRPRPGSAAPFKGSRLDPDRRQPAPSGPN